MAASTRILGPPCDFCRRWEPCECMDQPCMCRCGRCQEQNRATGPACEFDMKPPASAWVATLAVVVGVFTVSAGVMIACVIAAYALLRIAFGHL